MQALILVDIQNDFLPSGSLPVADGDQVVPVANRLIEGFKVDQIVATQDWHPKQHASFASNHPGKRPFDVIDLNGIEQVLWPDHCVQNTPGAEFAPGLKVDRIDRVFRKGEDPQIDSYSGFYDNGHLKDTGLGTWLEQHGVREVYILGLALDVCVKYTALDAQKLGFQSAVVIDGCRGVNVNPSDSEAAVAEMRQAGVQIVRSSDLLA